MSSRGRDGKRSSPVAGSADSSAARPTRRQQVSGAFHRLVELADDNPSCKRVVLTLTQLCQYIVTEHAALGNNATCVYVAGIDHGRINAKPTAAPLPALVPARAVPAEIHLETGVTADQLHVLSACAHVPSLHLRDESSPTTVLGRVSTHVRTLCRTMSQMQHLRRLAVTAKPRLVAEVLEAVLSHSGVCMLQHCAAQWDLPRGVHVMPGAATERRVLAALGNMPRLQSVCLPTLFKWTACVTDLAAVLALPQLASLQLRVHLEPSAPQLIDLVIASLAKRQFPLRRLILRGRCGIQPHPAARLAMMRLLRDDGVAVLQHLWSLVLRFPDVVSDGDNAVIERLTAHVLPQMQHVRELVFRAGCIAPLDVGRLLSALPHPSLLRAFDCAINEADTLSSTWPLLLQELCQLAPRLSHLGTIDCLIACRHIVRDSCFLTTLLPALSSTRHLDLWPRLRLTDEQFPALVAALQHLTRLQSIRFPPLSSSQQCAMLCSTVFAVAAAELQELDLGTIGDPTVLSPGIADAIVAAAPLLRRLWSISLVVDADFTVYVPLLRRVFASFPLGQLSQISVLPSLIAQPVLQPVQVVDRSPVLQSWLPGVLAESFSVSEDLLESHGAVPAVATLFELTATVVLSPVNAAVLLAQFPDEPPASVPRDVRPASLCASLVQCVLCRCWRRDGFCHRYWATPQVRAEFPLEVRVCERCDLSVTSTTL